MEKRLMTFIACLFLSLGMALAQTQVVLYVKKLSPLGWLN